MTAPDFSPLAGVVLNVAGPPGTLAFPALMMIAVGGLILVFRNYAARKFASGLRHRNAASEERYRGVLGDELLRSESIMMANVIGVGLVGFGIALLLGFIE